MRQIRAWLPVVTDPHWERHLQQITPMTAGLDIQATTGLSSLPLSPWPGLGVLAAWAGGRCWPAGWCCGCETRERCRPVEVGHWGYSSSQRVNCMQLSLRRELCGRRQIGENVGHASCRAGPRHPQG
jgi:hypothetical protein